MAPRVSVIIPVYNAGPYLRECLDSLARQDLGDALEVIAVDDGSTDASGATLDEQAARDGRFQVVHQENSGWPGRPRNVGLARARGTYVFFMDADDYAGEEAMRRLADFADDHGSDVVVPKMVPVGGRYVANRLYAKTQVDAHLPLVFRTISPQKLFRRAFVEEHGLRFPEEKVRLEDGMFVVRAYLLAERVSLASDYDYYFLRARDDGGNISRTLGDPRGYIQSIGRIIDIVREHAGDDRRAMADAMALDIYRRKGLKHFGPERFFNHRPARLKAWFAAAGELAQSHIGPELERDLPLDVRLRSRMVRRQDLRALTALVEVQRDGGVPRARVRDGRVLLRLPQRAGEDVLDVTRDVTLQAGLRGLRAQRGYVDVRADVRLRGVRVDRLPLTIVVRAGRATAEREVVAARGHRDWCAVHARMPDAGGPQALRHVALRVPLADGHALSADLGTVTPRAVAAPQRPERSVRAAAGALNEWTRHPALAPVRERAIAAVRGSIVARRVYRRAKAATRD